MDANQIGDFLKRREHSKETPRCGLSKCWCGRCHCTKCATRRWKLAHGISTLNPDDQPTPHQSDK